MKFGGAPKCPRCSKSVYAAEEVKAANQKWHKACFRCATCGTGLASNNLTENEGEIYCKACYGNNFGPKGFGYGTGAGVLSNTGVTAKASKPAAAAAPAAAAVAPKFCAECGQKNDGGKFCAECGHKHEVAPAPVAASKPKVAASKPKFQSKPAPARVSRNPFKAADSGSKPKFGGGNKCGKCGKTVYFAEEKRGGGKIWHTECFKCNVCNKRLDSTTLCEAQGPNGVMLYCRADYAKAKGPKGFGIGGGTATHTQ